MSSGTQVELDWTEVDAAPGGASTPLANGPGSGTGAYLTDEEILGLEPVGVASKEHNRVAPQDDKAESVGARHAVPLQREAQDAPVMPEWMVAAAGDPKHGAEAHRHWREHQAFRESFSSPDEARAMKELFPGGAQEAQTLRQAAQAVDQLDAAIYSGDARAQSEVVAELARANPAAFRQLFSEAAKVLAGLGQALPANQPSGVTGTVDERWGTRAGTGQALHGNNQTPTLSATADEGWGTQRNTTQQNPVAAQSPATNHAFDPAA